MKINPLLAFALVLAGACAAPTPACTPAARIADLPAALDEASGIAASLRHPGVLWVHNDSEGTPLLYALDHHAQLVAEIAMPGARRQSDWEDIATGPCEHGTCLYIGDIGDNLHDRTDRAILRIEEPPLDSGAAPAVQRFPFRYPDGPEDAEALFVTADTSLYIITKGRRSAVSLFRLPKPLRADEVVTLELVQRLTEGIAQLPDLVTGADTHGGIVAIRSYSSLQLHRFDGDTLVPLDDHRVDLAALSEPQGEGVAFAGPDTLLLVTERGPQRVQPFLARVTCTQP